MKDHSFSASYGNREYCATCGDHRTAHITAAPEFPPVGATVRVVRGISETEKNLAMHPERTYTVLRYTHPHGYAVIQDGEWGNWHVHPEALEAL